jgi:hypothetical protein
LAARVGAMGGKPPAGGRIQRNETHADTMDPGSGAGKSPAGIRAGRTAIGAARAKQRGSLV